MTRIPTTTPIKPIDYLNHKLPEPKTTNAGAVAVGDANHFTYPIDHFDPSPNKSALDFKKFVVPSETFVKPSVFANNYLWLGSDTQRDTATGHLNITWQTMQPEITNLHVIKKTAWEPHQRTTNLNTISATALELCLFFQQFSTDPLLQELIDFFEGSNPFLEYDQRAQISFNDLTFTFHYRSSHLPQLNHIPLQVDITQSGRFITTLAYSATGARLYCPGAQQWLGHDTCPMSCPPQQISDRRAFAAQLASIFQRNPKALINPQKAPTLGHWRPLKIKKVNLEDSLQADLTDTTRTMKTESRSILRSTSIVPFRAKVISSIYFLNDWKRWQEITADINANRFVSINVPGMTLQHTGPRWQAIEGERVIKKTVLHVKDASDFFTSICERNQHILFHQSSNEQGGTDLRVFAYHPDFSEWFFHTQLSFDNFGHIIQPLEGIAKTTAAPTNDPKGTAFLEKLQQNPEALFTRYPKATKDPRTIWAVHLTRVSKPLIQKFLNNEPLIDAEKLTLQQHVKITLQPSLYNLQAIPINPDIWPALESVRYFEQPKKTRSRKDNKQGGKPEQTKQEEKPQMRKPFQEFLASLTTQLTLSWIELRTAEENDGTFAISVYSEGKILELLKNGDRK